MTTKRFGELTVDDLGKRVTATWRGGQGVCGSLEGFASGSPLGPEFWLVGHTTHWTAAAATFEIEVPSTDEPTQFKRGYVAALNEAALIAEGSVTDDLECDARARLIGERIRDAAAGLLAGKEDQ